MTHASVFSGIEEWKPIVGYEGWYEVSSFGRVRSVDRLVGYSDGSKRLHRGRILKATPDKDGYDRVVLSTPEGHKNRLVHRLMAIAFIPNPDNLPEVNHKDENKRNNVIDNLEWCTDKYNVNYGTGLHRRAASQRNDPEQSKPIIQYDKDGRKVAEYPSIREAARQTGIKRDTISRSCRGLQKYCHRYYFIFKESE